MTAQRQDGKTARPRASQALKASMLGPVGRPAAPAAESAPVEPVPAAVAPVKEKPRTTKYTALLDDATGVAFDELALVARRKLGRRVDKSELVRALILLAADDASLRDQVIGEVQKSAEASR